MLLSACFVIM